MNRTTLFLVQVLALALLNGCGTTVEQTTTTSSATTDTTAGPSTSTTASARTTTTTVLAEDAEAVAIREAIVDVLGEYVDFSIARFRLVGPWAGALIVPTDPHLDPGAFLLYREGTGWWRVVDYGTGNDPEDWRASGAPRELAEWF